MSATAMLERWDAPAGSSAIPVGPLVLIDGRLTDELWAASLSMAAPLDSREASLWLRRAGAGFDPAERRRLEALRGTRIALLQPIALRGGESRLMPLLLGRIDRIEQRLDGGRDEVELVAVDDWRRSLERPINAAQREALAGGAPTVESVLSQVSGLAEAGLSLRPLSDAIRRRAVSPSALRGATIGAVLEPVLREHGLILRRTLWWAAHRVTEQREVRPLDTGRPVRLALGEAADAGGAVEALRSALPTPRPLRMTAEAAGQVVESTFGLVGGWEAADESLPDAEYARSTSGDFDAVANVFRLWVLNEDGAFSGAPFHRGPAFDLTSLFDEGRRIDPRPLRFGEALTMDGAGRSRGVVLESSTDGGATWSHYPGSFEALRERAGAYLDDDALPSGFLAAAKVGLAAVRITAALRSPLPLTAVRWRGNPFAGSFEPRRLWLGERFAWRRVAATSRYFDAVRTGQMEADETDDRAAMAVWLAEVAERQAMPTGRAHIETTGPVLGLRLGDRLVKLAGRSVGIDTSDPATGAASALLVRITHRWDGAAGRLEWRVGSAGVQTRPW